MCSVTVYALLRWPSNASMSLPSVASPAVERPTPSKPLEKCRERIGGLDDLEVEFVREEFVLSEVSQYH